MLQYRNSIQQVHRGQTTALKLRCETVEQFACVEVNKVYTLV